MRVTQHSDRTYRRNKRPYNTRHNDRNFTTTSDHIDPDKTSNNEYWTWCGNGVSFEDAEQAWYDQNYSEQLSSTNDNYAKNGHSERQMSMADFRQKSRYAPEEVIMQVGKVGDCPSAEKLLQIFRSWLTSVKSWNYHHDEHMHILDWALHTDEQGAPHIHLRRVWDYYDSKDGTWKIGQEKALEQAGVPLPHPDQPIGRFNNRKMTFDSWTRDEWARKAKLYVGDIETSPLPKSEVGKPLDQYIREQENKREKKLLEIYEREEILADKETDFDDREKTLSEREKNLDEREKILTEKIDKFNEGTKFYQEISQKILKGAMALPGDEKHWMKSLATTVAKLSDDLETTKSKLTNWQQTPPDKLRQFADEMDFYGVNSYTELVSARHRQQRRRNDIERHNVRNVKQDIERD